ncbi:hypothetical protein Taro_049653, partial [Colocasia esculenta]|nr:hypothetical protein [Colocasia esculenta]
MHALSFYMGLRKHPSVDCATQPAPSRYFFFARCLCCRCFGHISIESAENIELDNNIKQSEQIADVDNGKDPTTQLLALSHCLNRRVRQQNLLGSR